MTERPLTALVGRWEEARAAGRDLSVEDLCRECPERAAELRAMLEALRRVARRPASESPTLAPHEPAGDPAATLAAAVPRSDGPAGVPGYEIEGELGRGGMGVVYKARQKGLNRPVALKMVLGAGHAGQAELERFRVEAEAVASLQHPHIVQVFEVGEHDGHPFLSLELCPLGSLEQKLNGTPLPAPEAGALVRVLANAVQAAHHAGIIHRDLKPANVLFAAGEPDRSGGSSEGLGSVVGSIGAVPKITDFGLAKRLGTDSGRTRTGAILGTPSYMAPEQAAGQRDVGPPADIYALGAILYECLTGRPPFRAATPLDTVLQVVSDEPAPPRQLNPQAPRDLETICLKCLQKEPKKRYASAAELADDLARFLADEPIRARPVTPLERGVKWARRRPAVAGLMGLVLALTGLGVGLVLHQWWRAEEASRREAARAELEANARAEAEVARELAGRKKAEAEELSRLAGQRLQQLRQAQRLTRLTQYSTNIDRARDELRGRRLVYASEWLNDCPLDVRGWEWAHLKRQASPEAVRCAGHPGNVWVVAWSPDGARLATGGPDQTIRLWDPRTGRELLVLEGHKGAVAGLAFSPDGRWLASATATEKYGLFAATWESAVRGDVKLWDTRTWRVARALRGLHTVAFSPDSKRLATATPARGVSVCDVETGKELRRLSGHHLPVGPIAFSPDGTRLLTGAADRNRIKAAQWASTAPIRVSGELKVWHLASGKDVTPPWPAPAGGVRRAVFLPDGRRVASLTLDGTLEIWSIEKGKRLHSLTGHDMRTEGLALLPGGEVLTTGLDARAIVWDAASGEKLRTIDGPDFICDVTRDGRWLASAGTGGRATRVYDLRRAGAVELPLAREARIAGIQFSPDGKRLYALSAPPSTRWYLHAFDAAGGRPLYKEASGGGQLVVTPDGKHIVVGGTAGLFGGAEVYVRHAATGKLARSLKGHTEEVVGLSLSADGRWLASTACNTRQVSKAGEVCIWDLASHGNKPVHRLPRPAGKHLFSVAMSGDGRLVAAACLDGRVYLFDRESGKPAGTLGGSPHPLRAVAFRPDGAQVAAGNSNGLVLLWDVKRLALLRQMPRQDLDGGAVVREPRPIGALAYSRDGRRLFSASGPETATGEVKLWDPDTGQELLTLPGRLAVAISPDGRRVAAGAAGLTGQAAVRVWSEPQQSEFRAVRRHAGSVRGMAASPDGKRFASAADDGSVRLWDAETGEVRLALEGHEARVWAVAFSPDGRRLISAGADGARLWDLEAGKPLRHFKGHQGDVCAATFLDPGRAATGGFDGRACIWRLSDGRQLRTLRHGMRVFSLAASPDGKQLASGADHLRIWDTRTGEERLTIEADLAVTLAWSPDGERVAAAENSGALRLWDARDGALALDLGQASGRAWSLSWGQGGRLLAAVGEGRVVTAFDARTGKEAATFSGPPYWGAGVACLAGGLLASGDATGTVHFFRLPEAPVAPRAARPAYPPNESYLARVARRAHGAGRHGEALKHARAWRERSEWNWGLPAPQGLALEALALHALNRGDEAARVLVRLRELMRNSWCREDAEAARLYREASAKIPLPSLPAEEEALRRRTVGGSEAADWTKPDPAAFLARYLAGARSTEGRGPRPGPHDVTRDLAGLRFLLNCWYTPPGPLFRSTTEVEEVKVEGDTAEVLSRHVVRWRTGFHHYDTLTRLARSSAGWKIVGQRTWAVASRTGEKRTAYDEAAYRALDGKVEAARKGGDLRELRQALADAHRQAEAHAAAKKVTDQADVTAADQVARGEAALSAGDAADAITSARRAQQLDAKIDLPVQLLGALRQAR
jgi:WD40 repeat protein/serine/threonine protein kinase